MSALRTLVRTLAGTVLEFVRPALARELDHGRATPAAEGHSPPAVPQQAERAKALIRHARLQWALWRGDPAAIEAQLVSGWRDVSRDGYYDVYADRFAAWFFGPHQPLMQRLLDTLPALGVRELVEIGCGDGRALEHCAAHLPTLDRFVGIDINAEIIARNRLDASADARIEYVVGDAGSWIAAHPQSHRALLSYGGVMEYFAPATLRALFRTLATHPPSVVALCEPVDPAHDLARDTASRSFGVERSFSHHHAHLLRDAGFEIAWRDEVHDGGVRWMMLVATRRGVVT